MKRREACLLGLCVAWGASAAVLACGSTTADDTAKDGGLDSTTDVAQDVTTKFDTGVDTGQDTGSVDANNDTGPDDAGEGGILDADLVGDCSPANTACDLVVQDCPKGQECILVSAPKAESGLGFDTACKPTQKTEHLPAGSFCCPESENQCDPGLSCEGTRCLGDGGADGGGGRCTPACCLQKSGTEAGADPTENCGTSPEGYIGLCDLQITGDKGRILYGACTYEATCTVFAKPCPAGYTCNVENPSGTSRCAGISGPGGGPKGGTQGTRCRYVNECADELACITFTGFDSGVKGDGICTYMCYIPGGEPPFDAGILDGAPGSGGCPGKTTCVEGPTGKNGFPSWLGVCAPP